MKTYFIDKIQNHEVSLIAESINDLQMKAVEYYNEHFGGVTKIYVHCSHVLSTNVDEQNVEYIVMANNKARTVTTRRI